MNEAFELSKFNKQLKRINKLKKKLKRRRLGIPSADTKRLSKVINLLDYAINKVKKVREDFKNGSITRNEARVQIKKSRDKLKSTIRYLKRRDLIGLIGDAASYRLATLIQSVVSMLVVGGITGASMLIAWKEEEEGEHLVERQKMSLEEMLQSPEAKKMYRELSLKYHPDRGGDAKIMRRINTAKGGLKGIGDERIRRLYNELEGKKGPKPSYDDTTEEPKDPINYQDIANEVADELNKQFRDEGFSFSFMIRKSGKMLNMLATIKWPDKEVSSLLMRNIRQFKTAENFSNAIYEFVTKLM
jgi:hypothetical protein